MWPWAHAGLGYLCYVALQRIRGRPLTDPAVIALAIGTQLPDLIDKPLAWYAAILPYGRSFAHSLVTGVPLIMLPIVALLVRRGHRTAAGGFVVGYLAHLLGDGYLFVLQRTWGDLGFLLWPLVPPPATEVEGLALHLLAIQGNPPFLFGLAVAGIATLSWLADGRPGISLLRMQARHTLQVVVRYTRRQQ